MAIRPTTIDAYVLARLISNQHPNGEMAGVSDSFRPICEHLAGQTATARKLAWEGFRRAPGVDGDALVQALADVDPLGPPPAMDAVTDADDGCATLADIRRVVTGAKWNWQLWLATAVLNALAADPGTGKTILAVYLAWCLWANSVFPDGQANEFPAGTRTLWVAGDRHFPQLVDLAARFGLPDEAMLFNAPASNGTAGLDLDDGAEVAALEKRIRRHRPGLVIVDTVGMTTAKNLCRPEEARSYFGPLMDVAQNTETAFLLLTHLSKDAEALGRRIVGACRTVWQITAPDPDGQPDRRRLWVAKSYAQKPPALGMTIADTGCTFDFSPPSAPPLNRGGRPPAEGMKARQFIIDELSRQNDQKGCELIDKWLQVGEAKGTIFNARRALQAEGLLVIDDSRKPQIWHLVTPRSETVNNPDPDGF